MKPTTSASASAQQDARFLRCGCIRQNSWSAQLPVTPRPESSLPSPSAPPQPARRSHEPCRDHSLSPVTTFTVTPAFVQVPIWCAGAALALGAIQETAKPANPYRVSIRIFALVLVASRAATGPAASDAPDARNLRPDRRASPSKNGPQLREERLHHTTGGVSESGAVDSRSIILRERP